MPPRSKAAILCEGHDRLEPIAAEGTHQCDIRPIVQGDGPNTPLPPGGSAIQASYREIDAGLIDKLHAGDRARPCVAGRWHGPAGPACVAFGGMKGLFSREPQALEDTAHGGHPETQPSSVVELGPEFLQGRIGLLADELAH